METGSSFPVTAVKAHLSLNVSDLGRSIAFYRSLFGIEPSRLRSDYAKFDVVNPPLNLSLNQNPVPAGGPLSHLGIQVSSTAEVHALRDAWAASGLATRDEMETVCCYAAQDKAWTVDPDGNEWEVFVVHAETVDRGDGVCCTLSVAQPESAGVAETVAPEGGASKAAVEAAPCCEPGSGCC